MWYKQSKWDTQIKPRKVQKNLETFEELAGNGNQAIEHSFVYLGAKINKNINLFGNKTTSFQTHIHTIQATIQTRSYV